MTTAAYHQISTTASAAPPGCPRHGSFSPLAADYLRNPYPIASALRDSTPVVWSDALGFVVVTSMDLVSEVFLHPDIYSSENVQDPVFPICPEAAAILAAPDFDPVAVMSNRQAPDHARIRNYTSRLFSASRISSLEPYIRRRTNELIDDMIVAGSPGDVMRSLAQPLPAEVVFRFIGFPPEDDLRLKQWCSKRLAFSWGRPDHDEQLEISRNMVEYWRYVRRFVADRAEHAADDLASELLSYHRDAPADLTYREVESVVYGLSFAGHEPVTFLIGNALATLLPRREIWSTLVADRSALGAAVDEVIRWDSPQIGWRRITTCETELGGVRLPAGTRIFLNLAAANRDPAVFAEPDEFAVERPNATKNISFGRGSHFCLGAKFARFEARVVLDVVLHRLPELEVVPGQALDPLPNISFRGPRRLDVTW